MSKKILLIFVFFFFSFSYLLLNLDSASAFGLTTPFGGKITATPIVGIVCGVPPSPPTMIQVGGMPVMIVITPTTSLYKYQTVLPTVWALGLYLSAPVPCFTTTPPPAPAGVAFQVTIMGTSLLP